MATATPEIDALIASSMAIAEEEIAKALAAAHQPTREEIVAALESMSSVLDGPPPEAISERKASSGLARGPLNGIMLGGASAWPCPRCRASIPVGTEHACPTGVTMKADAGGVIVTEPGTKPYNEGLQP